MVTIGATENGIPPDRCNDIIASEPPWRHDLCLTEGTEEVKDVREWLSANTSFLKTWKWEHTTMKEALQGHREVERVTYYINKAHQTVTAAWTFSQTMVGHPGIVHGGASAFAFDDTFGILFMSLDLGPGFTANLNVDYRKPFPAGTVACLHASVTKSEGRKVWLRATLSDGPKGTVYSEATALFIRPRQESPDQSAGSS